MAVATESQSGQTHPDGRRRVAVQRLRLGAIILLLVALGLVFPFPLDGRLWSNLFNLAHAPTFFLALLSLVGILDPPAIGLTKRFATVVHMTWARILLMTALLMAVGGGGEFLQKFAGRNSDWNDVFANSLGLLAAVFWIAAWKPRGRHSLLMMFCCGVILFAASRNAAAEAWDSVLQAREFPSLASFERPRELGAWVPHNARVERSTNWAADGDYSAKVSLSAGKFPGVFMEWFPTDWRSYNALLMEFRNPNQTPLTLVVKLFDEQHIQSGFEHSDRFHRTVVLPPEADVSISIPLADVASAPKTRSMRLGEMAGIDIFCADEEPPPTFFLDQIRLANDD
jgi:hypothetical protein